MTRSTTRSRSTNTSSADTPNLAGTVDRHPAGHPAGQPGPGAMRRHQRQLHAGAGDPDPLINTATVTTSRSASRTRSATTATRSTNLFQPSVDDRQDRRHADKIGDPVNYTIRLSNTSSADSPNLVLDSVTTAAAGLEPPVTWPRARQHVDAINATHRPAGRSLIRCVNTATVTLLRSASRTTSEPTRDHEPVPAVGDHRQDRRHAEQGRRPVDYTITVTNTSSSRHAQPGLHGRPTACWASSSRSTWPGRRRTYDQRHSYNVPAGDPDPCVNTATVTALSVGFPNILATRTSWTTNLFQPSVNLTKTGDTLRKVGDPINYVITVDEHSRPTRRTWSCTVVDSGAGVDRPVNLQPVARRLRDQRQLHPVGGRS